MPVKNFALFVALRKNMVHGAGRAILAKRVCLVRKIPLTASAERGNYAVVCSEDLCFCLLGE